MSRRELTCVICPIGCNISIIIDGNRPTQIIRIQGNACKKGAEWAHQEVENPLRIITSSISVIGGDFLLASVKTTKPIPLIKVKQVMKEIHERKLIAPVSMGEVVISNPANCDTEIVVTRSIQINPVRSVNEK